MSVYQTFDDEILICPFNKRHKIAKRRFQRHISQCSKLHSLVPCPFNSTHYHKAGEDMDNHIAECPDNRSVIREMAERSVRPVGLGSQAPADAGEVKCVDTWSNWHEREGIEKPEAFVLKGLDNTITLQSILDDPEKLRAPIDGLFLTRLSKAEKKTFYDARNALLQIEQKDKEVERQQRLKFAHILQNKGPNLRDPQVEVPNEPTKRNLPEPEGDLGYGDPPTEFVWTNTNVEGDGEESHESGRGPSIPVAGASRRPPTSNSIPFLNDDEESEVDRAPNIATAMSRSMINDAPSTVGFDDDADLYGEEPVAIRAMGRGIKPTNSRVRLANLEPQDPRDPRFRSQLAREEERRKQMEDNYGDDFPAL